MSEKIYTIIATRDSGRGPGPDRTNKISGTLPELIQYFGYTLEVGASWNPKVKRNPKTIRSFVSNLQKAYEAKEACCYSRTQVYLEEPAKIITEVVS